MAQPIPSLKASTIEMVARTLGDTSRGLTGSKLHNLLLQAKIKEECEDMSQSKWVRIYNACANYQNRNRCANNILNFIKYSLDPALYVNDKARYDWLRLEVNKYLAFEGYDVSETGGLRRIEKASTIDDVLFRVDGLKKKLDLQGAHEQVFKYCTRELLAENYFHAVFEACKGLFNRIRDLSGVTTDGNHLIEEVFSKTPIVIINNYKTQSEKDEHNGCANLLKGLCGMFRNPEAHEPRVYWEVSEQDALEILGMISYCHRRLDNAQRIK